MSEQPEEQPGTVVMELRITAEAEVIPGPETLAAQAEDHDDDEGSQ